MFSGRIINQYFPPNAALLLVIIKGHYRCML